MKKVIATIMFFVIGLTLNFTPILAKEESIDALQAFKIFEGFEDGSLRLDETITRAQMAKIIDCVLGIRTAETANTIYSDVPKEHWASGYINAATNMNILCGFEDGTFRPEETLTYEQVIKIIVCALGYKPMADANGGWYGGYFTAAAEIGLIKNNTKTEPTRRVIADLIYSAFDIPLMGASTWNTDGKNEYTKTNDTILSKYLKVTKWEGVVKETPFTLKTSTDETPYIELADSLKYEVKDGVLEKVKTAFPKADCSAIDVNDLLGKKVVCYTDDEDNLIAITEKKNTNTVKVINASDLENNSDNGYIKFDNDKIKISKDLIIYKNHELIADSVKNTEDLINFNPSGNITFISNDNDSTYDILLFNSFVEIAIVKEVRNVDGYITFNCYTGSIEDYDTTEDNNIQVIKDGKTASIKDIAENDVVSIVDNFYYVSSKNITGTVEEIRDDKITIGGKEYKVTSTLSIDLNDYGIFYIDVNGDIVYYRAATKASNKYGIITAVSKENKFGEIYKAEVVFSNGTSGIYTIKNKATFGSLNNASDIYDYLVTAMDGSYRATPDNINKLIFSLSTKDDYITQIEALDSAKESGRVYDSESMSYGSIDINKSSILFAVDDVDEIFPEDISIGKAIDYFVEDEGKDYIVYGYDEKNSITPVLIGFNITNTIVDKNSLFIVSSVSYKWIENVNAKGYSIKGMQNNVTKTITLYNENGYEDEIAAGDIVLFGPEQSNGYISKYKIVYSMKDGLLDSGTEDINYYVGEVSDISDTKLFFTDGNSITMKSATIYTLVDTTGKEIEIKKTYRGTSLFNKKYKTIAFIKDFEGKQSEIIIYR